MNRTLHVVAPADEYTPGGVATEIPLSCISDTNKVLPVKVSTVIIRIITTDPLTFEILNSLGAFVFGVNEDESIVLPGSKIYNPCTEETIYVTEYINDIVPFIGCCSLIEQGFVEAAPPSEDDLQGNIDGIADRLIFYSLTEDEATALNGNLELSEEQEITVNWGDGSTEVLTGADNYNFAHVYNFPGSYGIAFNFADGSKLTKIVLQNANVTGVSGLDVFANLVELEISNSLLSALPVLPAGLLKLNFNKNNVSSTGSLPVNLTELQCAENVLTTIAAPNTVTKLICACNNGISSFGSLPTSLLYFDASNCALTALPALPAGLTDMYIPNNNVDDIPALPANIKNLNVSDNSLDVAELDSILSEIVGQVVDNGLLEIQDQTPLAEVDAPGAADIVTLQGRGWTVNADIA